MNNYIAHENQTLLDVSAHIYGRIDVVVALSLLNNISIDEVLTAGKIIRLVETPVNLLVKKSIESRNIIPASALTTFDIIELPPTGIGYMQIENNFKVL